MILLITLNNIVCTELLYLQHNLFEDAPFLTVYITVSFCFAGPAMDIKENL